MDLKEVLGEDKEMETGSSEEGDSVSEYDAFSTELGETLGLDEEKATKLRDIICGLARQEMEGDLDEEPEEMTGPKGKGKKGLALVLG